MSSDDNRPSTVITPQYSKWQDELWAMFDDLGEFRQGVTWLSNVVSRARLVAATPPTQPGDEPQPIDPESGDHAIDYVRGIADGVGGQSELLRSMTVHLTVPGEGWFIAKVDTGDDEDAISWKVYAADEIKSSKQHDRVQYFVKTSGSNWDPIGNSIPVRVWRPHDRAHWEADSSARAALPIMRRLELLNRHVDAHAMSRLAANGVYWVASEITFPPNPKYPESDDPFVDQFIDNGITAIKTPGSASAALPIINRAPFQFIKDGIRLDTFTPPFDEQLLALREFEVRRLATAMDVPPEVLLGMAGVNHWGAWQIEESALKTTVTSILEIICWALTTSYLMPALEADHFKANPADLDGPDPRVVWYDISELSVRPDRSQDALTMSQRLLLKDEALFRETGFGADDKLVEKDELTRSIALRLIDQGTPNSISTGLQLLKIGNDILPQVQVQVTPGSNDTPSVAPTTTPPTRNGDSGEPPQTQTSPSGEPTISPTRRN